MGGEHVVYAILMRGLVLDDVDPSEFKYAYVGYTNDFERRMIQHLACINNTDYKKSKKLYNRLRYYGWDNFDKMILMSGLTEEEAKDAEIEMIAKYNTFEQGMNSAPGGEGFSCGADHPFAKAVNVYNNSTGEIISFLWIGAAAQYLGVESYRVHNVVSSSSTNEQTYSPIHNAYFQIKYAYDDTPFIENMATPTKKMSESQKGNKYHIKAIKIYNNSTGEIIPFSWMGGAAEYLDINRDCIKAVVIGSSANEQTYSKKHEAYFQVKYIDDETPFIKDMPTPNQKKSGKNNYNSKPICALGKLYGTISMASDMLREVCNTKSEGNFMSDWVNRKKYQHNVFYVTKEFYERYKDTTERVTREMYDEFLSNNID